ncbi:MAG: hypothetical protein RIC80_16285 [Cyclobacteriaceae bacterium]
MAKNHSYLIASGSSEAIKKCKGLTDTALDSGLNKFSAIEELNPYTLILNFEKANEPRLEEIRIMLNEIENLVVCSFKSEEVLTISHGKVRSIL